MSHNPTLIFLPMLAVVALTFVAFVRMAAARAAIFDSMEPDYYRAHLGKPEPESARVAERHYGNLFELPTLFYAACLTGYVMAVVGRWTLVFAWGYVAARILQSLIHTTYNKPSHRAGAFVLGIVFALALWINLAVSIFARV
ncbi:MAPEG family protein [Novosphingobium resinovorum]|uniref:MAPEG family protein n=1 Tax=Novosphingobium resinovorum TaxID=158500 RepID=UPI002ED38E7C|nr:MAPEG family protein [Novosphingobium resinovorum]